MGGQSEERFGGSWTTGENESDGWAGEMAGKLDLIREDLAGVGGRGE